MSKTTTDGKQRTPEVVYWNCWTRNYSPREDGFIIHAFQETIRTTRGRRRGETTGRTLCGFHVDDSGLLKIPDEVEPSCFRCRHVLQKRGVIAP